MRSLRNYYVFSTTTSPCQSSAPCLDARHNSFIHVPAEIRICGINIFAALHYMI